MHVIQDKEKDTVGDILLILSIISQVQKYAFQELMKLICFL